MRLLTLSLPFWMRREMDVGEWRIVHGIVGEGGAVRIEGLNPWDHKWISTGAQIVVPHPQYPDEQHTMPVYEIHRGGRSVTFAAGEFSNLAYGFYVCV